MEKINFDALILEETSESFENLKNDKRVLKFLSDNNLDFDELKKYPIKYREWINQLDICDKCEGLKYCKQPNKGRIFDLKYDGVYSTELTMCRYLVEDNIKRKHLNNYLINDLSEYMKTINFTDINLDNEDSSYLNVISEVFDCLDTKDYGLYLYGNIGSGKTFLAACACNKLAKEGKVVSFVNLPTFAQKIKSKLENNEYQKDVKSLINSEFLVIDDIGAESVTSWFRDEILFTILNDRMENKKWTWFTSNEDFTSLEKHFEINNRNVQEKVKAQRIIARIKTLSKPLIILGKDRRIQ
ncbi:MAG: ATP-binding protein [Erysipelotrichaceae bacterium]|nr:ATP-binding protein [Erysipelotrichaceae bacterium]